MRLIDRLLSRWYVPREEHEALFDDYWEMCDTEWRRYATPSWTQMRNAVCNQPCIDVSRCDNGCWRARSATRTGPEFVVATDFKTGIPCS